MAARKIVRRSCLGARPRYNLVVDEDVKKPNKQSMYLCISLVVVGGGGGAVAQSVERTTGEEVSGSIPVVADRSLLVGSVSV